MWFPDVMKTRKSMKRVFHDLEENWKKNRRKTEKTPISHSLKALKKETLEKKAKEEQTVDSDTPDEKVNSLITRGKNNKN